MAEFNPFLPQSNIPNWADAPGRLIDGSGFGDIFASVAQTTAKAAGEYNVQKTTNELYKSADAAGEEGHLEGFAAAAGLPVDVARGMSKPELWKKAFEKGNYSDSFFYTKMDSWAKEMKSKYPNYADAIDQQVSRVMGRTPANALYSEMQQNYNDLITAKNAAESKDATFLQNNAEYIEPEVLQAWGNLTDDQKARAKTDALIKKGDQSRFEQNVKNLEANSKAGALEAAPVLSQGVSNLQRKFWIGATNAAGGDYNVLQDTIKKMAEGGFSPEELTQISQIVAQKKQQLISDWNELVTKQGDNGKSLQDYFANNPELFNTQKAKIDEMVKGLDDLAQGKTGYVEWNATMAEAERDQRMQKLKETIGDDAYDGIKGMQELLGPGVYETVMAGSMQKNDAIQKAMDNILAGTTFKIGDIGTATKKVLEGADPSLGPVVNKAARQNVETQISVATNAEAPKEARQKSLSAIFGDKDNVFIRTLKDTPDSSGLSSREKFYLRMQSAEVAKAASDLGMGKEYTDWLKRSGVALLAGNVEQVNATNKSTKYMDISFNGNTMQFEAKMSSLVKDPQKLAKYLSNVRSGKSYGAWTNIPTDVPLEDLDAIRNGIDSVQKMNMVTKGLVQAIKADKPGISPEDLSKELQSYFGDVQASYQKEDYWQTAALKAIGRHFTENTDGTVNQRLQQEKQGENFGVIPTGDTSFLNSEGSAVSATGTVPNTGDSTADSILAMIHGAEGADYNTVYGGGKVDASSMTVGDVLARTENAGSSAFGANQVIKKTLKGLVDKGVVAPDQLMDQTTQDKIGMALMEDAGYSDWKSGKLSTKQFANKLAGIWASLPGENGQSVYASDGVNKSRISRTELLGKLAELRD